MKSLPTTLESAIYEGIVTHSRRSHVHHTFSTRVSMCYLDLDEVPTVMASHPLWSTDRWRPVLFRRADYGPDQTHELADALRLQAATVTDVALGSVRLLAFLRNWGWLFNPITLAFCFGAETGEVAAVVATVTNTPWGERRDYVLRASSDGSVDVQVDKSLHVSPFFPMDQTYRFRIGVPGTYLHAMVDVEEGDRTVLRAGLHLKKRPLDRSSMTKYAFERPAMSLAVSARIYAEALRLAMKRAPFYPHPAQVKGR